MAAGRHSRVVARAWLPAFEQSEAHHDRQLLQGRGAPRSTTLVSKEARSPKGLHARVRVMTVDDGRGRRGGPGRQTRAASDGVAVRHYRRPGSMSARPSFSASTTALCALPAQGTAHAARRPPGPPGRPVGLDTGRDPSTLYPHYKAADLKNLIELEFDGDRTF
jgi:hypothetical protein